MLGRKAEVWTLREVNQIAIIKQAVNQPFSVPAAKTD